MKTSIIVSLQVEGIHSWPECPIEEVGFLRNEHRHIFFIKCKKDVNHNDRDIEIIQLKRKIQDFFINRFPDFNRNSMHAYCNFGRMSCEDIATVLLLEFNLNYCSVLEDNENGAEVTK
jgi:hypothetical protein